MLKNCMNKLPRMQDSATKIVVERILIYSDVSIM